jgi:hypothetical protein
MESVNISLLWLSTLVAQLWQLMSKQETARTGKERITHLGRFY